MKYIKPEWPAPKNIFSLTTLRYSGHSQSPFAENNLALHVGDKEEDVLKNRQKLVNHFKLTKQPQWLNQTHSTRCVIVETEGDRSADAAVTRQSRTALAILTADCLPILLCNDQGTEVAAIHAGWRGLLNGVIENTLERMLSPRQTIMAWVGPAICSNCYETGPEVFEQFRDKYSHSLPSFKEKNDKYHADLSAIAASILQANGLNGIYKSNLCTFEQENDFFSYRRDSQTGRIASLIWFN